MSDTYPFGQDIAWRPDPDQRTNLHRLIKRAGVEDYDALLRWATDDEILAAAHALATEALERPGAPCSIGPKIGIDFRKARCVDSK